jgi:hypothetical protein
MLRLRAAVTVLAVALLVTGWSLGDDKKDAPPPRGTLPALYKKLGLTDEQRAAILTVRGSYRAKIDALKLQITKLQSEEREETEKLLTDAQKARLKELRSGETKPKDGGKDKPAEKPPAKDKAPDKKP